MSDTLDTLLRGLPRGQAQYVRDHENGMWKVCVFKAGSVEVMGTVATNMDKNVACWMTNKLNQAFNRLHT